MRKAEGLEAVARTEIVEASQIFEEAVEFGLSVEAAERIAPWIAAMENDPRGPRQAVLEDYPRLAEAMGWLKRQ